MTEPPPTLHDDRPAASTAWLKVVVVAACLVQLTLGLVWSLLVPPFRGLDEEAHVAAVLQLATHDTWPAPDNLVVTQGLANAVTSMPVDGYQAKPDPRSRADRPAFDANGGDAPSVDFSQMAQHPPLGYAVTAAAVRLIPSWQGRPYDHILAVMRWVSALELALLPFLAYATLRRFTRSRWLLAAAALTPLLLPGLARAGGTVSNDPLQILLTSTLVWLVARIATGDRSARTGVAAGAITLLDLSTKGTSLMEPAWLVLAYAWAWWRSRRGEGWRGGSLGRSAVAATILTGLGLVWWVRNEIVYHAVQPVGGRPLPMPRMPAHNVGHFVAVFFSGVSFRFWGSLGLPEPPQLDRGLTVWATAVTLILVVVGLVVAARNRQAVALLIGLFAVVAVLGIVAAGSFAHYRNYGTFAGVQGRYLYPVAIALTPPAILALGTLLRGWLRPLAPVTILILVILLQGNAVRAALASTWSRGTDVTDSLRVVGQWAPFAPWVTQTFFVVAAATMVGLVLAVLVPTTQGVLTGRTRSSPSKPV